MLLALYDETVHYKSDEMVNNTLITITTNESTLTVRQCNTAYNLTQTTHIISV